MEVNWRGNEFGEMNGIAERKCLKMDFRDQWFGVCVKWKWFLIESRFDTASMIHSHKNKNSCTHTVSIAMISILPDQYVVNHMIHDENCECYAMIFAFAPCHCWWAKRDGNRERMEGKNREHVNAWRCRTSVKYDFQQVWLEFKTQSLLKIMELVCVCGHVNSKKRPSRRIVYHFHGREFSSNHIRIHQRASIGCIKVICVFMPVPYVICVHRCRAAAANAINHTSITLYMESKRRRQ